MTDKKILGTFTQQICGDVTDIDRFPAINGRLTGPHTLTNFERLNLNCKLGRQPFRGTVLQNITVCNQQAAITCSSGSSIRLIISSSD